MITQEANFIPFTMEHLQISNFPNGLPVDYFKGPKFWHFWSGNILLGTLLVEKTVYNGANFFKEDFKRVISKTIQTYQELNDVEKEPWATYFDEEQYEKFVTYVQKVTAYNYSDSLKQLPISVIICTAGRPKDVEKCIQSLQNLAYTPKQIVVVDNKPGNILMQFLQEEYPNITWVKQPKLGLDIARNTGLLNATEEIVVYVDDDVVVYKNWLYHVWESFENEAVQAYTGAVLPAEIKTFAQYQFEQFWSFYRGATDFFYEPDFIEQTLTTGPPVWKIGAGANMGFRKQFLIACGGFDERLDAGAAGCNGDSECWFRILKNGGTIHYNPRAIVAHYHRKDLQGFYKQVYNYMKGFTVAALIQQKQLPKCGYKKYLFSTLPRYYKQLAIGRGDYYELRKQTRFEEIYGMLAGIKYYMFKRNPQLIQTPTS